MGSFSSYISSLREQVSTLSTEDLMRDLESPASDVLVIDVRQRDEVADGYIQDALSIPLGLLELTLPRHAPDSAQELVFYCASGTRSVLAAVAAARLGYTRVMSLEGGFAAWKERGASFEIETLSPLPNPIELHAPTPEQLGAIPITTPVALRTLLSAHTPRRDDTPLLLDLREDSETARGTLHDATLLPRGFLLAQVANIAPDITRPIVLLSSRGLRAALAAHDLRALGYTKLCVLQGGVRGWMDEGFPLHTPKRLSEADRVRYSRHVLIPQVGETGQLALQEAKVLLLGAGGLGSPAALYLAAAGVGTLGLIDSDVVDRSNLQRQILHRDADVGIPKVHSAHATLLSLNPSITVRTYNTRLTRANVLEIFQGYDIVLDGGDNFPTRYLVNDACVHLGIPCVHGSVYRFEGQVTVFDPPKGPCYRCLYPEPPPPALAPNCAQAGVLGVLPGTIGTLQATETIKLILGLGKSLCGRLMLFDALDMTFKTLRLPRDPKCPACSGPEQSWETLSQPHFVCSSEETP